MEFFADILLIAGAFGAGTYCIVLARRLNRFNDLEKGVGGAIAVLSAQVDDMIKTLDAAKESTGASASSLGELTGRAEGVAQRLELLVASMHDIPEAQNSDPSRDDAARKDTPESPADLSSDTAFEDPETNGSAAEWEDDAAAEKALFKSTRNQGAVA
ncbi:MAG: hypothetical protein AAGM21_08475 [Pseudomonadota bacterium]